MSAAWSAEELARIGRADELQIAVQSLDGTLRRWVPIWVVCVGDQVYVRTWYRRDNGWFGHVLDSRLARVRVPGGSSTVDRMVNDDAAATTLQLNQEQAPPAGEDE